MQKKRGEKVVVEKVYDVECDICHQSCTDPKGTCLYPEYATLRANWGFDSNKDCEEHDCEICESCYDKVRAFIEKELRGTIRVRSGVNPFTGK